jgi:hypothetical protein
MEGVLKNVTKTQEFFWAYAFLPKEATQHSFPRTQHDTRVISTLTLVYCMLPIFWWPRSSYKQCPEFLTLSWSRFFPFLPTTLCQWAPPVLKGDHPWNKYGKMGCAAGAARRGGRRRLEAGKLVRAHARKPSSRSMTLERFLQKKEIIARYYFPKKCMIRSGTLVD